MVSKQTSESDFDSAGAMSPIHRRRWSFRATGTNAAAFGAEPWKRSPESTSSISIILALRRPTALMASTQNLPSQMNHDVMV
jgi:hypothetical protein